MFAVKLANFLMFAVSEETVKCLEGSLDIFGNGRTSSLVFVKFRQSSEIWNKSFSKMAENSLIYKTK